MDDDTQLKTMVREFYQTLFSEDGSGGDWVQTNYTYPQLGEEKLASLRAPLKREEIKAALFDMGKWKALGPDGFPAGFYQHEWDVVAKSLCEFAKRSWCNPEAVVQVNQTNICLIPKVSNLEFVNQFRPISLCNVSYKILTKVIIGRLKNIIPKLISPYQAGFVPGRSIHENIVVAQMMLHSMGRMRSKRGFFAVKVDLAKAYDRLRWSFIKGVLTEVGLPMELVNFIMGCITSVTTNVLWNGSRSEFFSP